MMPTYPGFSFEVKVVEPERALVLFTDTALAKTQIDAADWKGKEKMQEVPDFAASWGFYLEPQGSDKTRLVERFRVQAPPNAPAPVLNEVLGTGIVLMARKQLIGIKERVERARYGMGPASARPERHEPVRVSGRRRSPPRVCRSRSSVQVIDGGPSLVAQVTADRLAAERVLVL